MPHSNSQTTAIGSDSSFRKPSHRRSFTQKTSPFARLKSLKPESGAFSGPNYGKFAQYFTKFPNAKHLSSWAYFRYEESGVFIPPYRNYISTKRNILTEDDKQRTFMPYQGEDFDQKNDRDYHNLEKKIEANQKTYHTLNALNERATLYSVCVYDFLDRINCDVEVVLRYLLDANLRPPQELPSVYLPLWLDRESHLKYDFYREDDYSEMNKKHPPVQKKQPQKRWRDLYLELPKISDGRRLAIAGLACAAFAKVAGFSIWHVLKKSRVVQDLCSGKKSRLAWENGIFGSDDDSEETKFNPLGTYAELVCSVCKA